MSATQQQQPAAAPTAADARRRAAKSASESYMQLLQMIFTEKQKIEVDESQLMQHEQDAIRGMSKNTRMYALAYGGATGAAVSGLMRAINPSAFRVRHRFWAWVAPSVAWGALQGMQTGVRASTVQLLNLPESPFSDRLVTHLEEHVPDSPLLREVSPNRKRANWGIDAGPEEQRQLETGGGMRGQTDAALGAIALSRPQYPAAQQHEPPSASSDSSLDQAEVAGFDAVMTEQEPGQGGGYERSEDSTLVDTSPAPTPSAGGGSGFFGNVYGRSWSDGGSSEHPTYSSSGGADGMDGGRGNVVLSTAQGPEGRAARMAARKAERERRDRDIGLRRQHEKRAASGKSSWIESDAPGGGGGTATGNVVAENGSDDFYSQDGGMQSS